MTTSVAREPAARAAGAAPSSAGRPAAFFDVDGTLTKSDIFRDLIAFRRAVGRGPRHTLWVATLPFRAVLLLATDCVSRTAVNRINCAWHAGLEAEAMSRWAQQFQAGPGLARLHARGWELLRRHAAAGHRIVLVTGTVDRLVTPLARLLETRLSSSTAAPVDVRVEAVRLEEESGIFTGRLAGAPLGGVEKARRARAVAAEEGLDLRASHAYGDSFADVPLLEAVGHPAAVNPDRRLRLLARRRGWPVLDFSTRKPRP